MLKVHDLSYRYEKSADETIYEYDIEVFAGEVIGILGPSGSGKSTLLDLLAGFLPPLKGTIILNGDDITDLPPEKRPVSILFQQYNLFEHLSAIQNVLLGIRGEIKGSEEEVRSASDMLSKMDILEQKDRTVSQLSGGQQQRVALARVLIRQKPILLLDEPFTGLDTETRMQMLHLVRTITDQNKLHTVMVTHDKGDCDAIADKIYTMNNGILEIG